jgi:hypothetical protein
MVHRSVGSLATLLVIAGCSRDLTLPPPPAPPGPGAVYGKVVVARAGSADRFPVSGAVVEVLSTGLSTRSSVTGDFFLSGITATQGTLLVRWASTGAGAADMQRAIDLATVGVGPGRQVSLGEIPVVENARVHGVALRGDVGASGGHGGTVVFVPEGPFTTYSNDDGTFTMRDLPAGSLRVEFFRAGYKTVVLDAIELRGGEDLALRALTLVPDGGGPIPPPGSIGGQVVLSPPATGGSTTVTAVDATSTPFTGTVDAAGGLAVAGLPPGLYQVIVAHDGYVPAMAANVLVLSGKETTLADVRLAAGSGGGGACVAGGPCQPTDPCKVGRLDCGGGGAVCTVVGNAFDGTACGSGQACLAGACEPLCVGGASCQPADPCRLGTLTCSAGSSTPSCTASALLAQDGTACGAGHVCHAGACDPCVSFAACSPPNPCHTGVTLCNTGVQVCADTAATLPDGTSCGLGFFCHTGTCTACSAGALCAPPNDCHAGITDCATGAGACSDTGSALANGTPCASRPSGVCFGGGCATCLAGGACVPSADPCQLGTLSCASGVPACRPAGAAPELSACSTGAVPDGVCRAGVCGAKGNTVTVPAGLTGVVGSPVGGIVVTVRDQASLVVAGANVLIAPVADGVVTPSSALTNGSGLAGPFSVRLGRLIGDQAFTVSATAAPVPATLTIRADPPSAGVITTVVNAAHAYGSANGPALDARLYNPLGLAASRDGSLYVADYYNAVVRKVSAAGVVTTIAGILGTPNGPVDNVQATSSPIGYPAFLALDDQNHLLYLSDNYNQRVRRVDLASGIIDTVAGGGTAPAPGYGDGGAATAATISGARWIGLAPDGSLFLVDIGLGRVRRVDLFHPLVRPGGTGTIDSALATTSCGGPLGVYSISSTANLAWDGQGNVFAAAGICGNDGTGYTTGVVRWKADAAGRPTGAPLRVAGMAGGAAQDGIDARLASLGTEPLLAFDPAGNLYLSIPGEHRVRRVDAATFRIDTVAGTGVPGFSGDGGPATAATLDSPQAIAFDPARDAGGTPLRPTDLLVVSSASHDLRLVRGAGQVTPSTARLALAGGDLQQPRIDESPTDATATPPGQQLSVTLTDSAGGPLGGRRVDFAALDPSSLVQSTLASTDQWGYARTPARVGLKPITYAFRASALDLHGRHLTGSPVDFTWTARAPAAGEIFSAVGADHTAGTASDGTGPGRVARTSYPTGLAVAVGGDVYFSEYYGSRIKRLRPDGIVEVVAGTGSVTGCGAPDNIEALTASIGYPTGLTLDEAAGRLYFSDAYCQLVRYVDLAVTPNRIRLVAGGGNATAEPYGDGADPTVATFSGPSQLTVHAGSLYVADVNHARIRRIDLTSRVVSTYLKVGVCAPGGPVQLYSCGDDRGCQVAVDSAGTTLVTGYFCGIGFGASAGYGVARVTSTDAGGSVTGLAQEAGTYAGDPGEAALATSALFASSPSVFPSPDGTLWLVDGQRLRFIPASAPGVPGVPRVALISTWAGTTVAGSAGEYAPRSPLGPHFNTPFAVRGYPGGHLILSDRTNNSLRIIW